MDLWLTTLLLVVAGLAFFALCCSLCAIGLALWEHGRKDWTQDHDY